MKKREIKEDMRDRIQIKLDAQIPAIFEEKKGKAIKGAIKENAKYGSMFITKTCPCNIQRIFELKN